MGGHLGKSKRAPRPANVARDFVFGDENENETNSYIGDAASPWTGTKTHEELEPRTTDFMLTPLLHRADPLMMPSATAPALSISPTSVAPTRYSSASAPLEKPNSVSDSPIRSLEICGQDYRQEAAEACGEILPGLHD